MSTAATTTASSSLLRVALIQMLVVPNKAANITRATSFISKSAARGARLIVLPECWQTQYGTAHFAPSAELIPPVGTRASAVDEARSPSVAALARAAAEARVLLVGGSIPERCERTGRIYNTSPVFDEQGTLVARHRKVHLFDVDIPGGIRFKESDALAAGDEITRFALPRAAPPASTGAADAGAASAPPPLAGLGICFDMRFSEFARLTTADDRVKMLVFPGAFNTTTGPKHWELLQRGRAVDNQVFVLTASPARPEPGEGVYPAYGHSSVVGPWGDIKATCGPEETIVEAEIDLAEADAMRAQVPTRSARRVDLYDTIAVKGE